MCNRDTNGAGTALGVGFRERYRFERHHGDSTRVRMVAQVSKQHVGKLLHSP